MKKIYYIDLPLYEQNLSKEDLERIERQAEQDEKYIKETGKWPPIE